MSNLEKAAAMAEARETPHEFTEHSTATHGTAVSVMIYTDEGQLSGALVIACTCLDPTAAEALANEGFAFLAEE